MTQEEQKANQALASSRLVVYTGGNFVEIRVEETGEVIACMNVDIHLFPTERVTFAAKRLADCWNALTNNQMPPEVLNTAMFSDISFPSQESPEQMKERPGMNLTPEQCAAWVVRLRKRNAFADTIKLTSLAEIRDRTPCVISCENGLSVVAYAVHLKYKLPCLYGDTGNLTEEKITALVKERLKALT